MIRAMAEPEPRARRSSPATIILALAALLAASALAYAVFFKNRGEAAPAANSAAASTNGAADEAGSADAMVTGLLERLRADPDNHQGWFMLGLAYRNSERPREAAQAFRRAMELQPRNADYTAYLGEALLLDATGRTPPPEAERLFRHALELQPGHPQARYYLATLRDLRGDHRGALDDLIALLRGAPAGAVWTPQVRHAALAIAQENHIDIAGRLPPEPAAPPPAASASAAIPGPTPEQMSQASSIPPSQQDIMVHAMVDRLAARLRQNPRDADGWIRMMRSRMVLQDPPAAAAALRAALAAFHDDAPTQARLRGAAGELGIPAG